MPVLMSMVGRGSLGMASLLVRERTEARRMRDCPLSIMDCLSLICRRCVVTSASWRRLPATLFHGRRCRHQTLLSWTMTSTWSTGSRRRDDLRRRLCDSPVRGLREYRGPAFLELVFPCRRERPRLLSHRCPRPATSRGSMSYTHLPAPRRGRRSIVSPPPWLRTIAGICSP